MKSKVDHTADILMFWHSHSSSGHCGVRVGPTVEIWGDGSGVTDSTGGQQTVRCDDASFWQWSGSEILL